MRQTLGGSDAGDDALTYLWHPYQPMIYGTNEWNENRNR